MRFLTVNNFVSEILTFAPNTKEIIFAYLIKEAKKDKFGKYTAKPLYMILKNDNEKKTLNYDEIVKQFEEPIGITLSENKNSVSGVALCSISTEAQFSKKLQYNYYPRQFMTPGPNIIKEVNMIVLAMKEQFKPETFDI